MELNSNFCLAVTGLVLVFVAIRCYLKKSPFRQTLLCLLLTLWIGVVIAITQFPLPLFLEPGQTLTDRPINLVPFVDFVKTFKEFSGHPEVWYIPWMIIGGNVAMFVPLGILAPPLYRSLSSARRAALVILAAAASVELLQLVLGLRIGALYRQVDVNDVILNFTGGMIGYGLYLSGRRAWKAVRRRIDGSNADLGHAPAE